MSCPMWPMPRLLVLDEKTSVPGRGLAQLDPNADCERVLAFEWFALALPTPDEFVAAYPQGTPGA